MPELPEVESYRRLAERACCREIAEVFTPDPWYLKRGAVAEDLRELLVGQELIAARRVGKLLLLDVRAVGDVGPVPVIGMHFGMSGTLLVDAERGVDQLLYSSAKMLAKWDRFGVRFVDGGEMRISDPRRLGGVEIDPVESRLGPDARTVTLAQLRRVLAASSAPLKARIMDQARLAGVGNLIADETLWAAGIDPARPARGLDDGEVRRLHRALRRTIEQLIARGGSHTGDLMPSRVRGGRCPKDGELLVRRSVGGRTTFSCPLHQV